MNDVYLLFCVSNRYSIINHTICKIQNFFNYDFFFKVLKLLFISPRFSGGIGGHAAMLADQLIKYGFEVEKLEVPHIPIKNLKNPSFAIFSSLKGILNRDDFDIVHGFNIPSAYAMKFANGKKKVLTLHGVFGVHISTLHSKPVSSVAKIAESQVLKWPDALTTDSKATQKDYKEQTGLNFEVLPSAIDTNKFLNIPPMEKVENQVVFLGRETHEKGIDILKNAEPQIHGKVVYCDNLPWEEAMKILKSSQVLVVPSRRDSLPTVIKEAFYLKVPVIGTNVDGIPELIQDNNNGLLVPSENAQKLAEAVNSLLDDKVRSKKLADAGYEFVKKKLTWDVVLPRFIKFYEKLLH